MIDLNNLFCEQNAMVGKNLFDRIKYYKCPSISIATIEENKINTYCYGYKNREANQKNDVETLYQAGSISKTFFATSVMQLVHKGRLKLDCDIREYGNYYFYETFDKKEHKVTLRQLLSHTAGFNLHGFAGYMKEQKIPDLMQILTGEEPSNNLPLYMFCEPGTRWSYSGGGYMLAQKVVSDVINKDIKTIIDDEVIKPFGLKNSTYRNPCIDKNDNFAFGYDVFNQRIKDNYYIMPETAAAGLWSTPTDLVMFGSELMKACYGKSNVFEHSSMMEMLKKTIPEANSGCGLFVPHHNNEQYYFDHGGDNLGYHSLFCFQGATGNGYAVMINSDISKDIIGEIDEVLCTYLKL